MKYFTNVVKQYPQTRFIHIDFKHYNFMKLDSFRTAKRITAPLVYELTSLLVDMAKSHKIADSVIYNPEKITSLESYYDAFVEVYRSITGDIETEDNLVLKRNFPKTVEAIRLLNSKNNTQQTPQETLDRTQMIEDRIIELVVGDLDSLEKQKELEKLKLVFSTD